MCLISALAGLGAHGSGAGERFGVDGDEGWEV